MLFPVVLLTSCGTSRSLSYLRDLEPDTDYPAATAPELIVHSGDILNIDVTSSDPLLSAPFNPGSAYEASTISADGSTSKVTGGGSDSGYLVDGQGKIDFPIIGQIHVEGNTLKQIEEIVSKDIIRRGFIREPHVKATIANFQITVLGEVGRVGNFPVETQSINVLQALALAGDLPNTANVKDVNVIRTLNGVRREYKLNLRERAIFDSPAFYLQQNDIVYVKPRATKKTALTETIIQGFTTVMTTASAVVSVLWALDRYKD